MGCEKPIETPDPTQQTVKAIGVRNHAEHLNCYYRLEALLDTAEEMGL